MASGNDKVAKAWLKSGLLATLICGCGSVSALDVKTGDYLTRELRLDPQTRQFSPIAPITPTAITVVDGKYYVLDFAGPTTSDGLRRKLWRFDPVSGRQELVVTTDLASSSFVDRNTIAAGLNNDLYIFDSNGILKIDLTTDTATPFANTSGSTMTVAGNGNVLLASPNGIEVLDSTGNSLGSSVPGGFGAVTDLVTDNQGNVIGIQPNGVNQLQLETNLLSINPDTGATSIITTLQGVGADTSIARISLTSSGAYFISVAGSEDPRLMLVDPTTFAITDIAVENGIEVVNLSDVAVADDDLLLLIGQDHRISQGTFVLVQIAPDTHAQALALGAGFYGLHYALDDSGGLLISNQDDRILRLSLRTGSSEIVTSDSIPDSVIGRAGPVVVDGDNIYVIDVSLGTPNATLIHIDALTGDQTALTSLGGRNFLLNSAMIRDPVSGDLFYTSTSTTTNNAGAVHRVSPTENAQFSIVSDAGLLSDVRGLTMTEDGRIAVANRPRNSQGNPGIYLVDPATQQQSTVSESVSLQAPNGIALTDSGDFLVTDSDVIWLVNATTGSAEAFASSQSAGSTAEKEDLFVSPSTLLRVTPQNIPAAGPLVASILPGSRAVQVGSVGSIFATIINTGPGVALGCEISLSTPLNATFSYQTTDPVTNAPTGAANAPVDIPAGAAQSFVLTLTPNAALAATTVLFNFQCDNTDPAPSFAGVNSLEFLATSVPTPDVIALSATPSNDGIIRIPDANGANAFGVASANLGAAGDVTVSVDTGDAVLPLAVFVCETDAMGSCLTSPATSIVANIGANATPTFSVFVNASGAINLDPANKRVFLRFSVGGDSVGSSSVAVLTE